jgi:1,2-diacylglycerol 3-beta-galactosyltransferase
LFNATNSRWGERALGALVSLVAGRGLARLLARAAPDLVLTVHPLLTLTPWREWQKLRPRFPFVTVVTDLFDAHVTWFSAPADLLIAPTEGARARGLRWGFPPERMRVVGLPVGQKFERANQSQVNGNPAELHALRVRLGLAPDRFTILIVGGGEGMGPLQAITRALANAGLPVQLAVIAGRNEALRKKLQAEQWRVPVRVAGFVENMPDWMQASDLVVTKAGPGTIMETLTAGRPLLLSGYLPGQEKGNVDFVVQTGVGAFCDTPAKIAAQVREWLAPGNDALERMRARARAEARPAAAVEIAGLLQELLAAAPPGPAAGA